MFSGRMPRGGSFKSAFSRSMSSALFGQALIE
jgi:hypothetical protein